MWAVGLRLYALLTQVKNFEKLLRFSAVANIVTADIDSNCTDIRIARTSRTCHAFVRGLLLPNPQKRHSAQRVLDLCKITYCSGRLNRFHPITSTAFSATVPGCVL